MQRRELIQVLADAASTSELTQIEIAQMAGTSRGHLSKVLRGKSGASDELLGSIGRVLDLDLSPHLVPSSPDVYLASPVSALSDTQIGEQTFQIEGLIGAIESIGLSCHWPGDGVVSHDTFIASDLSAERNLGLLLSLIHI